MKFIIIFIIHFLFSFSVKAIDFVIDIDGVIIDRANKDTIKHLYPPEEIAKLEKQNRVIKMVVRGEEHTYILNEGAREFLNYLDNMSDSRITFFSAGPRDRNLAFLKHFKSSSGKTFLEIAQNRLFSEEDIIKTSSPKGQKLQSSISEFEGTAKKDIRIVPGLDLDDAILIDDRLSNASRGQEKNLLNVNLDISRRNPDDVLKYIDEVQAGKAPSDVSIGPLLYAWKNKLALTTGIIEKAKQSAKDLNIPLKEALWRTQWESASNKSLKYKLKYHKPVELYQAGNYMLRKSNPNFRLVSYSSKCSLNGILQSLARF